MWSKKTRCEAASYLAFVVERGELNPFRGFFGCFLALFDGHIALEMVLFCLNASVVSHWCLSVKLSMKLSKDSIPKRLSLRIYGARS
jgi:hypothetical protein